jgi:hypothetical protein
MGPGLLKQTWFLTANKNKQKWRVGAKWGIGDGSLLGVLDLILGALGVSNVLVL